MKEKRVLRLLTGFAFLFSLLLAAEIKTDSSVDGNLFWGIPKKPDQLLIHDGFAIGYSRKYRQAIWVSYLLSADHLGRVQVKRSNCFRPDPKIRRHPVCPADYRKTGYDKGHLAPAADMAYSRMTMSQSFYMSNMSPQLPGCNRGIWKRVESEVRNFARREQEICVITGPVFRRGRGKRNARMGKSGIPVPIAFYKAVLDLTPPRKMIGFLVPNSSCAQSIWAFAVSIDEVEEATGLNFFSILPPDEEEVLERQTDFTEWKTSGSSMEL